MGECVVRWGPSAGPAGFGTGAEGCDLPTLQRVCARYGAWPHGDDEDLRGAVLAGVTRSQSADWRAKVTWVFELGESLVPGDCYAAAAKRPAAVPSFEWLKSQHQLDPNPDDRAMMEGVAAAGDVAAAAWLLRDGVRPFGRLHAVRHGQLAILKLLHAKPERYVIPVPYLALEEPRMLTGAAAKSAQLEILRWLHETFGPAALDDTGTKGGDSPSYIFTPLTELAAWSGDVEVLEWLRERGCPLGECLWAAAADAGCEAMLERLDEWQVAKPASGTPFLTAARAGDAHTLRVLHRLGVPSGPPRIFTHAVAQAPLPALQLLLELSGTEVDWAAAEAARRLYLEETDRLWKEAKEQRV
ncbi:hypothetical protein HYH03_003861 [Edaphochlamys debaryana]|uniref:Ankyrin repeat domain-containing protein n=1 Tax=Edaphochlamys debaryana TaxID=47281 RepID=A0A836C3R8_9CHLO|nr:hypothetical protein HYH03_003861 [Edaphochlamys debaryana]|eukprot:KAG2498103.1 hypothetical protein HYH03_003861 [Edaphochlamys debaryana]